MRNIFQYVSLLLPHIFSRVEAQQLDPIKNMCQRFDHQGESEKPESNTGPLTQSAVIKNKTLYIDGGRQTFVDLVPGTDQRQSTDNATITEGYNNYLITVDLSSSWNSNNVSQNVLSKTPSDSQSLVPVLSRGALYSGRSDDNNIYLWGGTTSPWNESFPGYVPPAPAQNSLWSFSQAYQKWNKYDTGQTMQNRPSSGSSAEASDQGLAFFLNGAMDDHSQTGDNFKLSNDSKPFLEGMIVVDTVNKSARNISTAGVTGDFPRSRGKMEYVKNVGTKGILVAIGGNQKNVKDYSNQFVGDLVPMDSINVFDVASYYNASTPNGIWYKQRATGQIPESRLDHCLVTASAADNSSHNIYMIGGRASNDSGNNVFFDDVYILSLPSFTWSKIYEGPSPTYGHQCLRANSRMMIRSGGARAFKYDSLPCDDRPTGISIFDITENKWTERYDSSPPPYAVPTQVVEMIGGNRTGGATKLRPDNGFDQDGLMRLFGVQPTPKTHKSRHMLPTAPFIIAGVLGGVAILGVTGAFAFFYRRRLQTFATTGTFRSELDGEIPPEKMEMDACLALKELPCPGMSATPIKYVEPSDTLVELCGHESDIPWKELQSRDSSVPWAQWDKKVRFDDEISLALEPPVTEHGVPF